MSSIKKWSLIVLPLLIMVVTAEVASYFIWHNIFIHKQQRGVFKVRQILGAKHYNDHDKIIPHPYTLYWNNPFFTDEFGRQYDDNGYRSPKYIPRDNELRVLALGGSTTNSWPYTLDRTKIWTARLQKMLEDRTKNPVHVFNAGLPNGTSAELMVHYLQNGKYLKPHLVILHTGGNDINSLLSQWLIYIIFFDLANTLNYIFVSKIYKLVVY